jgi:hypothetical protein
MHRFALPLFVPTHLTTCTCLQSSHGHDGEDKPGILKSSHFYEVVVYGLESDSRVTLLLRMVVLVVGSSVGQKV